MTEIIIPRIKLWTSEERFKEGCLLVQERHYGNFIPILTEDFVPYVYESL
jgi:hypothetical protein